MSLLRIAPLCVLPGCPSGKEKRFSFAYLCKMTVFDYSSKSIDQGLPHDRQELGAGHTDESHTVRSSYRRSQQSKGEADMPVGNYHTVR